MSSLKKIYPTTLTSARSDPHLPSTENGLE